ncbi:hypothetical protein HPP92_026778 [Vanilla planifolia]|uniref:Uncharacterized protein n=1 Tax=Vanilla planifolia TaxID=51239 RepID=A0A835U6N2_VANPL|nr:hypothetical protein HPP92_026778 [Vanilla planifolia]
MERNHLLSSPFGASLPRRGHQGGRGKADWRRLREGAAVSGLPLLRRRPPELVGLSLHQARLPAMEVFVIRGVVLLLLHPSVVRIGSRSCN